MPTTDSEIDRLKAQNAELIALCDEILSDIKFNIECGELYNPTLLKSLEDTLNRIKADH